MAPVLAVISEWHIFLVLIIVFLLFGGKKLPELARGIGEAMKEFKKASRDVHDDTPHPPPPVTPSKPEITASSTPHPPDTKLN
jgi:sec-independent protein translocase protein TatA